MFCKYYSLLYEYGSWHPPMHLKMVIIYFGKPTLLISSAVNYGRSYINAILGIWVCDNANNLLV